MLLTKNISLGKDEQVFPLGRFGQLHHGLAKFPQISLCIPELLSCIAEE